jgi:hypothetical protein
LFIEAWRFSSPPKFSRRAGLSWRTPLNWTCPLAAVPRKKALKNLKEAVRLFLEEAEKLGTLEQILEEAGTRP